VTRQDYIRAVLALYRGLPHTAARRPSKNDRRIASALFDRNVSWTCILTAFYLATGRRICRHPQHPALPPIRSLAYFLPVIDDVLLNPPDPGYLLYLKKRLDHLVQFPTDSEER
jgi:hypothetical protein